jgi:ribonuclease HI
MINKEKLKVELEDLIKALYFDKTDLLLVGDGSGTSIDKSCEFSCVSFDRIGDKIEIYYGELSHGTNNLAELLPYIHALWAFEYKYKRAYRFWNNNLHVQVISDSELTVRQGNGQYVRYANGSLWSAIDWFTNNGYSIHWNHVRRNTNEVSALCDKIAGQRRKGIDNAIDLN